MAKALESHRGGKPPKKILLRGINDSGKSTFLQNLSLAEVSKSFKYGSFMETLDHATVLIRTASVGGRSDTRVLLQHFYKETDAVVFIVDGAHRGSIDYAIMEMRDFVEEKKLKHCPFVVVCNKQDLPNAMTAQELHEKVYVLFKKQSRQWTVIPTCATTGEGLHDVLSWIDGALKKDDAEVTFMKKVALKLKKVVLGA